MPTRIDPSLLAGSSASSSNDARYNAALAKAAQNRQSFQNQDWDPVIRPIERIFNALTAGGSGVMNAIDKGIKGGYEAGPIGVAGGVAGGFVDGFFASWNNDPNSENYMTGSKLLESATDRVGEATNPRYIDREDNVDPGLKFGLGLAADIALDPITYLPGGIIASGLRGAYRGAKAGAATAKAGKAGVAAAEGVPTGAISGALRGVFKGVPDQYKIGRITKAPKAIGIDQWRQVRNFDKINKLQRKYKLTEDMMFAITSGAHGIKALTEEILPGLRAAAGPEYKTNLTPEVIQEIADKGRKYIDDYTTVASGAEGARSVSSGMAAPEGASAYLWADPVTGKVKPAAASRPSALARREAVNTRLAEGKALSELEIQRFDVGAALEPQLAKRAELMADREAILKSNKIAISRAVKRNGEAERAAMLAKADAELKAKDNEIIALNATIAENQRVLAGVQDSAAELAAKAGVDPANAAAINETIMGMARNGIRYSPLASLDPSNTRLADLLPIDAEYGLTEGSSEIMLQALSIALKNGQIEDGAIGKIAGVDVALSDIIDLLFAPGGREIVAGKTKGMSAEGQALAEGLDEQALDAIDNLSPEVFDFYTDVVHQVLSKMWDITTSAIRIANTGMPVESYGRAANGQTLLEWAVTDAARESANVARETLNDVKNQLDNFTPEMREQRPEEYARLVDEMTGAENALRLIEDSSDPAINPMAPYLFIGGVQSATDAAKAAGITIRNSPEYQATTLQNIGTVRSAVKKIDLEDPAALQAKTDAVIEATSALIRTHPDTGEILENVKAIIGEGDDPARALLDIVFGSFRPLKGAEADPTLYAKLIIQLAQLPLEITGVSDVARLRARAFVEAGSLGVYGIENNIDEAALSRYGREMLNNFQTTGGYVSEARLQQGIERAPEDIAQEMSDLVNRQAKSADEANVELAGDNAGLGFGMGDEVAGIRGEGPLGALNLFGEVVARGNTELELARNLELYRGAAARDAATAVANMLESAITGRALEFRGQPIADFMDYWADDLAGFLSPNKTANIFEQSAGKIIRGRDANTYRRILDNDDAELDGYGTRLSPEKLLVTEDAISPLSFTHVGAFTLDGIVWQTGTHAFYGLMASPAARKRIAEAATPAEAKRIFDGLNSKDVDPKYSNSNNIERGKHLDAVADRVFEARLNVPGVRESMDGTRGFNVVDGFDRELGGMIERRIPLKTEDIMRGAKFAPLMRTRGANVAGRAVMRFRDKKLGLEAKNISFVTYENRLPVSETSGRAIIDTEFNAFIDANKDVFPDRWVSRRVAKDKADAIEEFKKANPDKEIPKELLTPGAIYELKVSDHILGYARVPLTLEEWVATIHFAASKPKLSKEFFGRYRAVAQSLAIPIVEKTSLTAAIAGDAVKAAYVRYRAEFDRVLLPEVKAGQQIRISEALRGRGDESMFSKQEFKDLKEESSTNFGVDPLGRTVRDEEVFTRVAREDLTLSSKLSSIVSAADVKTVFSVLKKSKTEEQVIQGLNRFLGEHMQKGVMSLLRHHWGATRTFGYTPESAGVIANIRAAIAQSPVGIQAVLEDLLPDLRLTRETQEDFTRMLQKAESIVTEERAQQVVGQIDVVLNGPAVAALADPTGEIAQVLLNFELRGKGVARKLAPLADEVITSSEKEARDWVTGGVKMTRDESDQFTGPDYTLYDSFSDIAVQDFIQELLPQASGNKQIMAAAKDAFAGIARKAQELHEMGPDGNMRIKVSAEQYATEMTATINDLLSGLKGKIEITREVPLSQMPNARVLLYTSEFRKTLEEFLNTAKYSLHTDLMKPEPPLASAPVPTWGKFVQKIDTLLGREVKGSGGVTERMTGATAAKVIELLQIDEAGHSRLISGIVNAKNADGFFTTAQRQIIENTNVVDNKTILAGNEIIAAAETVDEAAYLATIADDIAGVLEAARKTPELTALSNGVMTKFRQRIADSIVNTITGLNKSKNYKTYGNDVDRKAMHDILQEIDRAGRVGGLNADDIAELKYLALKIADEELARMGVSRVTALGTKGSPGRIAYTINGDIDWTYVGYSDILTVLRATGDKALASRLLSEIMPDTTKAIRGVETGLIFPPNVIAEMGVLTTKLRLGGVAEADAAAILFSTITERLRVTPKGLFNAAVDKVNLAVPHGENAERIAAIALTFARADVQDAILARHVTNGAIALRREGEIARNIAQPVLDDIISTRTNPLSTLDDAVAQIIKSSGRIRAQIEKFGVQADSLAAHLAKGTVQKLLNGVYNSTEINVARVTSRMSRVADEFKDTKPSAERTAKFRRIAAEENTLLASQRIKAMNKLSAENTAILIEDLVRRGDPISMNAAFDAAISAVEDAQQASLHLAQVHLGGPKYLEVLATQKSRAREIENGVIAAEQKAVVHLQQLNELAGQKAEIEARRLRIQQQEINGKPVSTTAGQKQRDKALAMIEEELNVLNTRIEELRLKDQFLDESFIPDDIDRIVLQSMGDKGRLFEAGAALSGSKGMETTISIVARTENSIDNNINSFEKQIEKIVKLVTKKFSTKKSEMVVIKGLDGEDITVDKAVIEWGDNLLDQVFLRGVPIEKFLKKITDPEMRVLAMQLYELQAELFGEKALMLIRSGLDSGTLNKFIEQGPFGLTKAARFDEGRIGYELRQNLLDKVRELLDPKVKTGAGGADWITIMKGYSWSFQRAAMIPTIAAEFSAKFGHKAAGIGSVKEAIAKGYQAITKDGTLAKWLDPNSLYPPEYLRQLANTQRFIDINPRVASKFILGVDKVTGALKSSITLWRPGHHVVNIMGEFLMNTLAGVVNPIRYAQAWKTLQSVGEFSPTTIFGHNFDIPLNDFAAGYKTTAFTGKNGDEGIVMQLAGREVVISHKEFYRMLNEKGLLMNNNTAEDLIVQGEQITGSRNRYSGILGGLQRANEGLGAFSARRDNLFRIAHAIDIASKKGHRSMASMIDDISSEVMSYHPTMQLLSPFEKKYMRRAMYFYTWQRNAITVVFRSMLENPALFTLAPKLIYEASAINGDPESIGHPMPNDMRLPGFMAANTLGPHWFDENGNIQGMTLNAPQLDIFNTLFGELYVDPTQNAMDNVTRNLAMFYRENTIGQMSPLPKTIIEGWMGSKYTTAGPQPIGDVGDYLIDQTGLGYLSRIAGIGFVNNQGLFAPRTDAKDPETRLRYGINALSGLRFQDMSQYADVAKRQRDERSKRAMEELLQRLNGTP